MVGGERGEAAGVSPRLDAEAREAIRQARDEAQREALGIREDLPGRDGRRRRTVQDNATAVTRWPRSPATIGLYASSDPATALRIAVEAYVVLKQRRGRP